MVVEGEADRATWSGEEGHSMAAIIVVTIWMQYCQGGIGLVAYDCADQNVNITAISLRHVANCPEPESTYKTEETQVRVVQRPEIGVQHVWTCLVEVTRLITHCGMHSHSSVVAGGLLSYLHRVGSAECRMIHRYRVLKIEQQSIGQIVLNGTTTASITLQGFVDNEGKCEGVMYHENGASWRDVVITANVKITLMDYSAKVRLRDNEISLKGGVICPFLESYCFDSTLGESTWEHNKDTNCEEQVSQLYTGKAEKVTNILTGEQYLVVNQDTKTFAVTLIKKVQLCGAELWQTEHPQLLLCEGSKQMGQLSSVILPDNTDIMLYINSKFLYVEQSYKRGLETLAVNTIHRRCEVHREILRNRLLMAPVTPDAVSQIIQEKEGYVGHVLGEVFYILKCVPKQVNIRRTDRCYQELPVEVNNQSKFMSPITRVLQDFGEEIDCNSLTPPLYYIDGEWIGLIPYPTVKHPPKELEVNREQRVQFELIQPLGTRGLYTQDEIGKVQKLLTFGSERKVVENIITRRVAGMEAGGQGFSSLGIFNPDEMKQLAHSTMRQLWGWFTDVGLFMSGLIGFYVIFRLIKYAIGVVINGFHLYQIVGGGLALLACLWDTLTRWVIHRHQQSQVSKVVKMDIEAQSIDNTDIKGQNESEVNAQVGSLYPTLANIETVPQTFYEQ